jgi:hypothetical protein
MTSDDLGWAHTRAEWDQAWNQARHLETMRGQWLGFFFTAVLGVTAVAGPRLSADNSKSLLVIAALALVLEVLSAALYLAVVRLNTVHHYYDQIILSIRDETISSPPAAVDLSMHRLPPGWPRDGRLGALATTKGVSRFVLFLGVVVFVLVLAGDLVRTTMTPGVSTTTVALCSVAFSLGLVIAGFCVWVLYPSHVTPDECGKQAARVDEPGPPAHKRDTT